MKNKFKKLTSLLLASIMMLVALPIQTLAAEWGKGDTVYAAMIGDFVGSDGKPYADKYNYDYIYYKSDGSIGKATRYASTHAKLGVSKNGIIQPAICIEAGVAYNTGSSYVGEGNNNTYLMNLPYAIRRDLKIALLTGSTPAKQKREIKKALFNNEIDLLIGTHALIQNDVEFRKLALVITDEQHRFGVNQRATLAQKGQNVHTIVMSATPIPRTLGLILYGDLDISVLDELPPGRQTVRTDVVDSRYHKRLYKFIKDAVARGEQCYIVCPAVEENETNIKSAEEFAEELANGEFKGYNLGILHGKMKAKDKEAIMKSFADGKVSILVATTVVEVGVDVPNATIMVIENAERFGLSTLHQLRGRVGRGNKQSYCVLVSDAKGETSRERLMTMKQFSDGFKIADTDLKLRGPGDFFGSRQHGLPELKIADMVEDMDTLKKAQECAQDILKSDFSLSNSPALKKQMNKMFEKIVN